jgi:preprotein translocase subunit SecE
VVALAAVVVWRQPVLEFAQRSAVFFREVRAEVRKVSWPSWDDLRRSTIVITIIVILIGIVIGLMDWVFAKILIDLFGRIFG